MIYKTYTALGFMSGTSLDGVDAALIKTDGQNIVESLDCLTLPYAQDDRDIIRACFGRTDIDHQDILEASNTITQYHIKAGEKLLQGREIDLIGFHGQTVFHDVKHAKTIQIGDAQSLADALQCDVIYDLRQNDMAHGGQGAPLLPVYHQALVQSRSLDTPCTFLNIGGVANVTWIDQGHDKLVAFDTGPGNALIDDWMLRRTNKPFDQNGAMAASGKIHHDLVNDWMNHVYFGSKPPKSLDRNEWDIAAFGPFAESLSSLCIDDGAATLTEFTVQSIIKAQDHFPSAPRSWIVCGGGANNDFLLHRLRDVMPCKIIKADTYGWNGDAIEAEGFAYLAVRHAQELPLTFPETTGVKEPLCGGKRASHKKTAQ